MDSFNSIIRGGDCETPKQCVPPSILETLKLKQRGLSEELSNVNEAIVALENNPDVAKVLNLVARAR